MDKAKSWVKPAMEKAYAWSGDSSLWSSSTRTAEHIVQAMEGDYFMFGQGRFIKYYLTSEVVSSLVNSRVTSGVSADLRAAVAALPCGVKLEAKPVQSEVQFGEMILVILFLCSARVSP